MTEDSEPSTSATAQAADPGEFPARPDLLDDFSKGASRWPTDQLSDGSGSRLADGTYFLRVAGGRDLYAVAAPVDVETANRGTLIEASVRSGPGGRVGLFCRGSTDGRQGYLFLLGPDGAWSVTRRHVGGDTVLRRAALPERDRPEDGELVLLRLVCGTGGAGQTVSMVVTINASGPLAVKDPDALAADPSSRVGPAVAKEPGAEAFEAGFDHVGVSLAVG